MLKTITTIIAMMITSTTAMAYGYGSTDYYAKLDQYVNTYIGSDDIAEQYWHADRAGVYSIIRHSLGADDAHVQYDWPQYAQPGFKAIRKLIAESQKADVNTDQAIKKAIRIFKTKEWKKVRNKHNVGASQYNGSDYVSDASVHRNGAYNMNLLAQSVNEVINSIKQQQQENNDRNAIIKANKQVQQTAQRLYQRGRSPEQACLIAIESVNADYNFHLCLQQLR